LPFAAVVLFFLPHSCICDSRLRALLSRGSSLLLPSSFQQQSRNHLKGGFEDNHRNHNHRSGSRSLLRPRVPGFVYGGGNEQTEDERDGTEDVDPGNVPPAFGDDPPPEMGGDDKTVAVINNNQQWYDDRGEEIMANDGGHITQFGDTYYWVGNDLNIGENGNDIHMYSSKTLGSSDWKWEGKMVDFEPGRYSGSCTLVRNPTTEKYMIICKGLDLFESDSITGPYEDAGHIYPGTVPFHRGYVWGGMSVYQEGNDAYLVVSRFDRDDPENAPGTRHMAIYKFTPDYKGIEEEVLWTRPTEETYRREAPWLFRRGDKYYMTMSHTRGWNPSETYYWTADSLYGPWTDHGQVEMVPSSRTSHNSQHRYIMQVGNGQWIFGGDRYPYYDSEVYPPEDGQNIILPVSWDGDKPVVNFEETWNIEVGDSRRQRRRKK